ncbi:hypothetical protein HZS_1189, partial [Henneguya salminicola]
MSGSKFTKPVDSARLNKSSYDTILRQKTISKAILYDKKPDLFEVFEALFIYNLNVVLFIYNYLIIVYACCEGRMDIIKSYIPRTGIYCPIVNKKDRNGFTLLHYAVRYNHYSIVKYLLACGADYKMKGGPEEATSLHFAARYKVCPTLNSHRNKISDDNFEKFTSMASLFPHPQPEAKFKSFSKASNISKALKEYTYDSQGVLIPPTPTKKKKKELEKKEKIIPHLDSIINALIAAGADVNARDEKEATPLHYAAMRRNVSSAEELLSYDIVNKEIKDKAWMTPLHYAAEQGCVPIASMLIEKGAILDVLNRFDMTPLHLACEEGHPDVAELLISAIEKNPQISLTKYLNFRDQNEQSALHYAAMSGDERLVSLLLKNEAQCLFPDSPNSTTPLHLACAAGNVDTVRVLIEKEPKLVNERNSNFETPLHIAASLNRVGILKYLLQQPVDLDLVDKDLETPLFVAAKKDHIEAVKLLVALGASITARNSNDYTPLHISAFNNALRCAELFLSLSQPENLQNTWDLHENRPIHLAVMQNHHDMVQLLISFTAPVESKNDIGMTPLLIAASKGHISIMKTLIEFSSPLALDEDDSNNTALHLGAMNGFYRAIPILVNSGVSVDCRNISHMTALDIACNNGHVKVVSALIDAEATINISENCKSTSPILIAAKEGHSEVITLLINKGGDVTKVDHYGRNCLEVAIDENRKEAVMAILNSSKWEQTLRHISHFNGVNSSPLRRLIDIMPDMSQKVFDKCMSSNSLPKNHPKYEIYCNYEYLEDMYSSWGAPLKILPERRKNLKSYSPIVKIYNNIHSSIKTMRFRTQNKNHPLSLIIEKNRTSLLSHPLIRYLVRSKWNRASFYIYYIRMLLMILNIIFFTGLCLATASPPYSCTKSSSSNITPPQPLTHSYSDNLSGCVSCPIIVPGNTFSDIFFIVLGKYFVVILSVISLSYIIAFIICSINNLTNVQTIIEIFGSIMALLYVSGLFTYGSQPIELFPLFRCTNTFRSVGALGLCLLWLSFVLFLSKLPKIGIYVVMYMDIFRTFLQFVPVYFMLILSFALPFYMLFLDRFETNSYITPFKALMKTLVATVGEIEYDTFYNTKNEPPLPLTYLILFLFILSNSIILMNLLVGLAVDDIQGVQSNAFLKRLGLQVKMTMDFESILPDKFLQRFIIMDEKITPNEVKQTTFWSWWEFKSNPF